LEPRRCRRGNKSGPPVVAEPEPKKLDAANAIEDEPKKGPGRKKVEKKSKSIDFVGEAESDVQLEPRRCRRGNKSGPPVVAEPEPKKLDAATVIEDEPKKGPGRKKVEKKSKSIDFVGEAESDVQLEPRRCRRGNKSGPPVVAEPAEPKKLDATKAVGPKKEKGSGRKKVEKKSSDVVGGQ
jgi:hypothetical protein